MTNSNVNEYVDVHLSTRKNTNSKSKKTLYDSNL